MARPFQRARRPEQIEARRAAILGAAAQMLTEMPIGEISLNELSRRVGLAKSNVLRYFETREAIFLELLDEQWSEWFEHLRGDNVPATIAETLAERPLLCELISATATVLERNISPDVARRFKIALHQANDSLSEWIRSRVPTLNDEMAHHFGKAVFVIVAGLWPLANPAPSVLAAYEADPDLAQHRFEFREVLTQLLSVQLAGFLALEANP